LEEHNQLRTREKINFFHGSDQIQTEISYLVLWLRKLLELLV